MSIYGASSPMRALDEQHSHDVAVHDRDADTIADLRVRLAAALAKLAVLEAVTGVPAQRGQA